MGRKLASMEGGEKKMKCTKCGTAQAKYSLGENSVCDNCLEEASLMDAQCPNCGQRMDMKAEQVAIVTNNTM